jgi:pimeloyl-ACP methyl ester carboxylesterase
MPETRWVEVEGVRTHVLQGGTGPPLLYLHGVAPAGEWLPVHEALAERFTVFAPDHPGFGLTERPEWLTGMDDLVLHYEGLTRALGLACPACFGFSLGGWLAAAFAATYPDRLSALVLHNAAGLHVDGALIPDLSTLGPRALSETVFHDPAAAEAYFRARVDPEARMRQYRAMVTTALIGWNPWFDPKLARRLGRVTVPTLVLWAEHDGLIPPVYATAYAAGLPNARVDILPDCGHMAPIERPALVAESVARFLLRGTAGPG